MRLGRDVEVRLLLLGLLLQVLLVLGSTVLEPILRGLAAAAKKGQTNVDLLDADAQVHGYGSFDVGVGLCARLKLRFEIRRVLSRKAFLLAVRGVGGVARHLRISDPGAYTGPESRRERRRPSADNAAGHRDGPSEARATCPLAYRTTWQREMKILKGNTRSKVESRGRQIKTQTS
jgi:hypothetical protein